MMASCIVLLTGGAYRLLATPVALFLCVIGGAGALLFLHAEWLLQRFIQEVRKEGNRGHLCARQKSGMCRRRTGSGW